MPKGPHPDSRLMREEDELGEGDDGMYVLRFLGMSLNGRETDMAEFTGAKERIALGKKARKAEERNRRKGMVEMIEDA